MENILELKDLFVQVKLDDNTKTIIDHVDINVPKGKVLGIIGESGSGKSVTMKSILNLLPSNFTAQVQDYKFNDKDHILGDKLPISVIFQDPMTSLNPVLTVGYHLTQVIRRNDKKMSKSLAYDIAINQLKAVGINNPELRFKQYPFELSGGQRQRVMIAMAILANPELLIADEPTTALDVTIQIQILKLIKELQANNNLSVILVTHDFGVVASMCDYVLVMKDGKVVEEGTTDDLFTHPQHEYTKLLLQSANLNNKDVLTYE